MKRRFIACILAAIMAVTVYVPVSFAEDGQEKESNENILASSQYIGG